MHSKISAVVFDFFGVVMTDALSVLCDELAERNPDAVKELRSLIHAANKGIIDPNESTAQAARLLGMTPDAYRRRIRSGEVIDDKLLAYIKSLRSTYKTALLSNITASGLRRRFPDDALDEYFDEIVVSSDIGYAKPEPEAYHTVAERLGLPLESCVFLDDRPDYCAAAEAVGMRAIPYQSFAQAKPVLERLLADS